MSNHFFFFALYRYFLWPLVWLGFMILGLFVPKVREGLRMRDAKDGTIPWLAWGRAQRPVWIHCASGELEYAKPVITRLKRERPELKVLVTYFSPSIARAAKTFPGIDFACPSPWDSPAALKEFIDWHRPRALLIARTDTWPEMLRQAKLAGLPTLLFSATLPVSSGRARGLGRLISSAVFASLDQIFCVSAEDAKVFASLGFGDSTEVAGDTRYDQVLARLASPKPLRPEPFAGLDRETLLVAGSTWEEDETVLIHMAAQMKKRLKIVLVPHEPTLSHLANLELKLKTAGLTSARYSTANAWPEGGVLLVDQIGILAELYRLGRFAFVGGSFRKTVHSVMEPLAAGCLTFVGPMHLNNREALEFKSLRATDDLHCVEVVDSAGAFDSRLGRVLDPLARIDGVSLGLAIQEQVRARAGKSERVVRWCLAQLH